MYKQNPMVKSQMKSVELVEGETIENKIERLLNNKEAIKDSAPMIYTERKDGVGAAYNIRTDRFEIAAEKMDMVNRSVEAKRMARLSKEEENAIIESGEVNGVESAQGKEIDSTK